VTYKAGSPRTVRVLWPANRATGPDGGPGETPGDTRQQAGRAPGDMDPRKVVWVPVAGQAAGGSPILTLEPDQERFPHNPAHTPIPGDRAIIRGKVVAVLRRV